MAQRLQLQPAALGCGAGIMVTAAGERIISCNDGRMSQLCGTLSRPFGSGRIVTISGNKIDNPPSEPFLPEGIMTFNDGAIDLQFNEFIDREYIAPARRNGPAIDQPSEPSIPNSSATSDGNTTEFDPKVLNQREVKIDKEEVCVVCLESGEKGESMVRLTCKHVFHKGCVEKWLQESQTCPSCRGPV